MKKLHILMLTALFCSMHVTADVDHKQHHKHIDVVAVNAMEVFQGLHEVVDLMKEFQESLMRKVEKIKKMEQDVIERERAFSMKAKNMTSDAREKERMEIERLKNEVRLQAQNLEERQQEEQMAIQQKIGEKIKAFCKTKGWKIVIPVTLYADPEFDKTQEVIDGMNKEYDAQKADKKKK